MTTMRDGSGRTEEEREYVLGTHDDELVRLGFQHQVWAEPTAACWERAGFAPGQRVLDVGCGPGYASFDLARLVGPRGAVRAVDVSARFVRHLEEERARRGVGWISAEVADLETTAPPPESVDGAFARWVLCFVADPAGVVERVARALRPGGVFAVMDYCHYQGLVVLPKHPIFAAVIRAVERSWRARGGDPDVGSRLPAMMEAAGLEVRSLRPLVRLGRPGTALWEWPRTFFTNFLPSLVEMGEITEDERETFDREWAVRARDPNAYLLTPPMVEVVAVKR